MPALPESAQHEQPGADLSRLTEGERKQLKQACRDLAEVAVIARKAPDKAARRRADDLRVRVRSEVERLFGLAEGGEAREHITREAIEQSPLDKAIDHAHALVRESERTNRSYLERKRRELRVNKARAPRLRSRTELSQRGDEHVTGQGRHTAARGRGCQGVARRSTSSGSDPGDGPGGTSDPPDGGPRRRSLAARLSSAILRGHFAGRLVKAGRR